MLPSEPRLPDARRFIDDWQYFIVHAPRQTGKTTTLRTLSRNLTAEGRHVAVTVSCEPYLPRPWLDGDPERLMARMLTARGPALIEAAHLVVDGGETVDEIVTRIVGGLPE